MWRDTKNFVQRATRVLKEEEIWPKVLQAFAEAHEAIEVHVNYSNQQWIHLVLDHRAPDEFAAAPGKLDAGQSGHSLAVVQPH